MREALTSLIRCLTHCLGWAGAGHGSTLTNQAKGEIPDYQDKKHFGSAIQETAGEFVKQMVFIVAVAHSRDKGEVCFPQITTPLPIHDHSDRSLATKDTEPQLRYP
jgi:hypothetical protein